MRPRLLDLFCGAGGCSVGYTRVGFDVTGVDIKPQPNYPFDFVQADALTFPLDGFDAIHASPPCQHHAPVTRWRGHQDDHPELIAPTRVRLEAAGVPYVLENVRTTALRGDFMLCGTTLGLRIRRHRHFETNWSGLVMSYGCQHQPTDYSFDHGAKQPESVYRDAMGCHWMTVQEAREAIPPAYTEWIGAHLLAAIPERTQ
jgi:DNA (cytosine-5)-methyltransferase 1